MADAEVSTARWRPDLARSVIALVFPSVKNFLFGVEPRQRLRMTRSALAAALYATFITAQWELVRLGLAERGDAERITILCAAGVSIFLCAIRSGMSTRFADAALTMPQMVFALVCVAVGYHANPAFRSSITLIVPLTLVFGAFILPAHRCVQLGWFAVLVFGATIGYGVWSEPALFPPVVEAHAFIYIVIVFPALAYLAGQLSQSRIDQKAQKKQLHEAMARLQRMATQDPLTGLPNRRHVDEQMAGVIGETRRRRLPLCVAIIDLDRFKRVNDEFGHAAGDDVLCIFASETTALLREGDLLVRWGGEEFLLILPATGIDDARVIVERMRARIHASPRWIECPHAPVTFSAGLTLIGDAQTLQQALRYADSALYEAKRQGRDRTVVASDAPGAEADGAMARPAREFLGELSKIS